MENDAECAVCKERAERGLCPACTEELLRDESFAEAFLQGRQTQRRGFICLADHAFSGGTYEEYLSAHRRELAVYFARALQKEPLRNMKSHENKY
ncbi:MAG: hypothetical protein GX098_12390 [Bacteroidales bacterium]|nr:hypothetical protein [Bacteroidales bacterium]